MTSLLVGLCVSVWPPSVDAGRADFASPVNWPNEPAWSTLWPLLSFAPAGWLLGAAEADAGVGMSVDRAFAVTRGSPAVTVVVINAPVDAANRTLATRWRLNEGELPDAGDVNGNGRLDVADFALDPRVPDVNSNGGVDLEDVVEAFRDGIDQDGNGRIDDVCGWNFDTQSPTFPRDGGFDPTMTIAAPVDDGVEGVGTCPDCTLIPFTDSTLVRAIGVVDAGVLLVARWDGELSPSLLTALAAAPIVVTSHANTPLGQHPAVLSPMTLTATADLRSAQARGGCDGDQRGQVLVSTRTCAGEAAGALAGVAGLLLSTSPGLSRAQLAGVLGAGRVDARRAVEHASPDAPRLIRSEGTAAVASPRSAADECFLDRGSGREAIDCDGGLPTGGFAADLDLAPASQWAQFIERVGASEWSTVIAAPPEAARRGLTGLTWPGWGSLPPRFVDLRAVGTDQWTFSPANASRVPFAAGLLDADQRLDLAGVDGEQRLTVTDGDGHPLAAWSGERLASGVIGGPVIAATANGPVLMTLERTGTLIARTSDSRWTHALPRVPVSGPAVGRIDGDQSLDVAVVDGTELHVLLTDSRGPTTASWAVSSRASDVLLANLTGDSRLEVIVDRVYDSQGKPLLTLDEWTPSPWPVVLSRVSPASARSLFQLERQPSGDVELARYDVEKSLRDGDTLTLRKKVMTLRHEPSPGGFAALDFTGDGRPDFLIPTLDGLLFVVDAEGQSPSESPLATWGTVLSSPTIGVRGDALEVAVRTTRGDVVTWLARGLTADITWDGPGHDESNARNAETKLHVRRLTGLGITEPPTFAPGCGCSSVDALVLVLLAAMCRRVSLRSPRGTGHR